MARLKIKIVCLVVVELLQSMRDGLSPVIRGEVIFTVQLHDRSRFPIEFYTVIMHPNANAIKIKEQDGLDTLKSIVLPDQRKAAFCRYSVLIQTLTKLTVTF